MSRTAGSLVVVLLLVLTGCSGIGGVAQPEMSSTTSSTTQPPERTTAESATTATTVPGGSVVVFEDLTAADQRFFLNLLDNDSLTAPPPFDLKTLVPEDYGGDGYEYVRYQGTLYEVAHRQDGLHGRLGVSVVETNTSKFDGSTIQYHNLSTKTQSVFEKALSNGSANPSDDLPLDTGTYLVGYDGRRYLMEIQHADYMRFVYSVEKVRDD